MLQPPHMSSGADAIWHSGALHALEILTLVYPRTIRTRAPIAQSGAIRAYETLLALCMWLRCYKKPLVLSQQELEADLVHMSQWEKGTPAESAGAAPDEPWGELLPEPLRAGIWPLCCHLGFG